MTDLLAAFRYVIDQLEAALEPPIAQVIPPLLTVSPVVTQAASSAFAAASSDARSPNRVAALREHYESAYGFPAGLRRGFDKTIWEPWRGVTRSDLEAVVAVGNALEVPAAHVLALWLQEGKHVKDRMLHGTREPIPVTSFTQDVTVAQVSAWVRSLILWDVLGMDEMTSATRAPGHDSVVDGADAGHDANFIAGLDRLREANIPGIGSISDDVALRYFSSQSGAFRSLVLTDAAGHPLTTTVPAGTAVTGMVRLQADSIASWLYLQSALFAGYRYRMEKLFVAEFGAPIDLSGYPWVTYLGWNAGVSGQFESRFTRRPFGETPEDRISQLFGDPPATPLSEAERALYYKVNGSTSALGNAIQFRYLIDAVSPWFG